MKKTLEQILKLAETFSGEFAFYARRADADVSIAWNADVPYDPASVIKLPILVACLQQVQQGNLSLDDPVPVREQDRCIGSGILKELRPGLVLTLEDLLVLMIIVSDNTATNLVLDRVPPAQVTACMRELGLTHTISARKIFEVQVKKTSQMTARETAELLLLLANRQILTPALCAKAIDILSRQQYTDTLARDLPFDPFMEPGTPGMVRIASKSGFVRGVMHDAGLVMSDQLTYAVALFSRNCADQRFHPDNEAKIFLGKVSRLIFDAFHQG